MAGRHTIDTRKPPNLATSEPRTWLGVVMLITMFYVELNVGQSIVSLTTEEQRVNEGDKAILQCFFAPANAVIGKWYWIANGSVIVRSDQPDPNSRYSLSDATSGNVSLIIKSVLRWDTGTFTCGVNDQSTGSTVSHSEDCKLTVNYLYKPVLSSFATPVVEGDMVEMTCSVDANPAPTYTFKKDGEVEQQGGSSTLTFQTVSRNNDGSYECEASNSADTMTSDSRMLEVHYAPEITPLSNKEFSPGDEVVISFDVVAKPTATYVWTTAPDTTDTDNNPETYTFLVSDNIDETYTVTLEASNEVGATQVSVEVKVVGLVPVPTSTSIASTTATVCLCDDSNTGLVVGMTFLGIFIGILLSSSVFVVLGKMKNSKPQVTEATSRNDKQQAAYMIFRGEPNAENQT